MDPNKKEEEMKTQGMIKAASGKCCADCKTTKTPLWRSGPSGPKSLCNACGIRHRKKSAAAAIATVGLKKEEEKVRKEGVNTSSSKIKIRANVRNGKYEKLNVEWRQRLMSFGEKVVLFQRQRSQLKKRQRQRIDHRKLGEVEQAAVLLMALSCGSVFA